MTYTDEDLEMAQDILTASDIGYWTEYAVILEDGSLRLLEDDEDATAVVISPTALLDWATTDSAAKLVAELGDPYQKQAVAGLAARDWGEYDYDVVTGDYVVQWIALGEIRYS